jgi:shikimate dehydrogenase
MVKAVFREGKAMADREISGATRLFYMIAHPIAHVRTPEMINPMFRARGIDAVMVPAEVAPEDFGAIWDTMRRTSNCGGCVVSLPHKEKVLLLSDAADDVARQLGVANVVRREADGRMVATNFDGAGFLDGMLGGGADAQGRAALLIGAGGGGRAIAFGLAAAGVARLRISDIDTARAQALAAEVGHAYPACSILAASTELDGIDLVVNATPCGLHPETDPLPLDVGGLRPGMIVADIIMKPRETPLLHAAIAAGCDVRYGAGMLDAQLELMIKFFGY